MSLWSCISWLPRWKTGGSYSHPNIQTCPFTEHFLVAAGCAHSHRLSSLQTCWQHAYTFRTALTTASAAPDPEEGTISSKHLTNITSLSSSYLPSTPPQHCSVVGMHSNMCFCSRLSKNKLYFYTGIPVHWSHNSTTALHHQRWCQQSNFQIHCWSFPPFREQLQIWANSQVFFFFYSRINTL